MKTFATLYSIIDSSVESNTALFREHGKCLSNFLDILGSIFPKAKMPTVISKYLSETKTIKEPKKPKSKKIDEYNFLLYYDII